MYPLVPTWARLERPLQEQPVWYYRYTSLFQRIHCLSVTRTGKTQPGKVSGVFKNHSLGSLPEVIQMGTGEAVGHQIWDFNLATS